MPTPSVTTQYLNQDWRELNDRYFGAHCCRSSRLEPAADLLVGMFVGRRGPATAESGRYSRSHHTEIRLSLPLLQQADQTSEYGVQEIVNTLAHEMIHQWQYDNLKRRPNHRTGPFLRKNDRAESDGALAITIYHSLQNEVLAFTRFTWRCRRCGHLYRRQRRTIQPNRHHAVSVGVFYKNWGRSVGSSPNRRPPPLPQPFESQPIVLYL